MLKGWEGAQGSQSRKVTLNTKKHIADDNDESEGDGSPTVAVDASNDCSEGLDVLATDIAELGVSVAGETKFRQYEHSNWAAVCQHHLY